MTPKEFFDLVVKMRKAQNDYFTSRKRNAPWEECNALKDRVQPQPKQEWTMQDEEELQIVLDTLVKAGQHSSAKWLKNVCLVPQSQWKPSDEQMKALFEAHKQMSADYHMPLLSLYNDLKKLTE